MHIVAAPFLIKLMTVLLVHKRRVRRGRGFGGQKNKKTN